MYNPYLIIPFVVWIITQFTKFVLAASVSGGKIDFRYLYASGGMPSVHSAVVTSLATTAFLIDGPQSPIFGITAILAAIVMYDSFGVRRSSGEQASAINLILDSLEEDKIELTQPQHRLRELLGHKPLEVTIGAGIGFVLACLFNFDKLSAFTDFVTTPIGQTAAIIMGIIGLLILLKALAWRYILMKKFRKLRAVAGAIKACCWVAVSYSIVLMLLAFLAYEKVSVATWLLWPILIFVAAIATASSLYKRYRKVIQAAIETNSADIDKMRWFEGPNKKRRAAKARAKKRR